MKVTRLFFSLFLRLVVVFTTLTLLLSYPSKSLAEDCQTGCLEGQNGDTMVCYDGPPACDVCEIVCCGSQCGGGGGNDYQAAPYTDSISVGSCGVTITHLGWDLTDNQPVGYRSINNDGGSRKIGMNDSGASQKDHDNLVFTNSWSVSGNVLTATSTINSKDAGNSLGSGWSMSSSNCTFNDYTTHEISPVRMATNSGSGSRSYTLLPPPTPTPTPTTIPTPTATPPPTATPTPTTIPTPTPTPTPTTIPTPTSIPTPTATPPPTNNPYGNHDTADSSTCSVSGWACDGDDNNQPIDVHIYADGLYGAGGTMIGAATANQFRSDLVDAGACGATGNHGFNFSLPDSFKNGSSHPIYIYGINIGSTGGNSLLANTPKTITCATPTVHTTQYRCSDVKFEKDDASGGNVPAWKAYQNDDFSGEPIRFKYTFTNNVVPGRDLTLFCQFKTDTGTTSKVYPKSIKYIGGSPKITSANCTYDPSGIGTQVIIKGTNFGEHSDQLDGNVKVAGKDTTISSWAQDVDESTRSATITPTPSPDVKYKIIAKMGEKLSAGRIPITVTTDDGRLARGYCNLGTTTIDFTAKVACRAKVADLSQDNVSVEIKENIDKAKSLYKKKIKLDNEGKPVDFIPELEVGKNYQLIVRTPRTVSRKVNFTTEEGTTTLDDIMMPIGDIYPVSSPDNIINTFDKSEMTREWSLITDVTRPADLNGDLRVNSVDYSCLLNNFNQSGN